ncbi:AAA family ATPase [Candidatus Dojkabacteria bacterium]|nr:AAA family ATPase [Candidatus Dojkabacteria bacterium]
MFKYIAIVGPIAAGKTTVAEIIKKKFGYPIYKLSQGIYDEADKRGLDREDRVVLQNLGDELREKFGVAVLAKLVIEKILRSTQDDKMQGAIIESIRNHNEVILLKKEFGKDLLVISVDAPMKLRYERAVKREGQYKEQHLSYAEFKEIAKRDLGHKSDEKGQNVIKCMELSDCKLENTGDIKSLENKLNIFLP